MEPNIQTQLEEQRTKLDAIYESVEKLRKYFLIIVWMTIIMFVLPLVGMLFAIPSFINTYTTMLGGL